jgi:hypothetical protein
MFINDLFNKTITESQTEKPSAFDTAKTAIGGAASKLGDVLPQAFKPFDEKTYTPQQTTKPTTKVSRKGGIEEATADDPKFQQMMGKVSQQKTPQQHIEELENVLYELKSVERNIQEITREIKYDRTAQDIMVRVGEIINPFRPYIEDIDYREPFEQIQEAVNQLESAIYGLDELAKRAEYTISTQIQGIQDEIDYPDDEPMKEGRRGGVIRSGSISESRDHIWRGHFSDGSTQDVISDDEGDISSWFKKKYPNKELVKVTYHGRHVDDYSPPQRGASRDLDDNERADRERAAFRSHDRKITEQGKDPWNEKYFGASVPSIHQYLVKTDSGKKYNVLGTTKLNAIKQMKHLHPNLEVVGIKFLKTLIALDGEIKKGVNDGSVEKLPDVDDPLARKLADRLADNLKHSQENYGFSLHDVDPRGEEGDIKEVSVTNEDVERYVESMQRHGYESVEEQKCPECGGVAYSDKMIAEEKDACYHKVKSRYKIWPSAYASGALVKCRKAGAKNWGNKSKK